MSDVGLGERSTLCVGDGCGFPSHKYPEIRNSNVGSDKSYDRYPKANTS